MVEQPARRLDGVFRALGDPTRRAMLGALARGQRTVTELAEPFPVSLAAISKHLKVLEAVGLVERRWEGRAAICRLNAEPLRGAGEWLSRYRKFWDDRLDALEELLREEQRRTRWRSTKPRRSR